MAVRLPSQTPAPHDKHPRRFKAKRLRNVLKRLSNIDLLVTRHDPQTVDISGGFGVPVGSEVHALSEQVTMTIEWNAIKRWLV